MMYIKECFKLADEPCPSTLDYLRNFEIIQYSDGTSLTFEQVSQTTATECAEIGGIFDSCHISVLLYINILLADHTWTATAFDCYLFYN